VPVQARKFSCVLVCLGALLLSPAWGQSPPASGWMELDCHPPLFLNLNLKGLPNDETLSVYLLWGGVPREGIAGKGPLPAGGKWCPAGGYSQCEQVKTTIEFKKFNLNKKAAGTYVVEISDGHKLEGSFSIVRKKQPKPFLCE
jgi:hypothetical protein